MKINTDTKYGLVMAILVTLFLVLISFVDSSFKPKEVFLLSFGIFLGVITQTWAKYIDHEKKDSN